MSDGGVYWRYLPKARRPRFTVVEYLIGALVLAIAIRVALPFLLDWSHDREARAILREVARVEAAARAAGAEGDLSALADTPPGAVPGGMDNYLPPGFSFDRSGWSLDWDLFRAGESIRDVLVGEIHGAITIDVESDGVRSAVVRAAGRRVWLEEDTRILVLVPNLTGAEGSS